MRKYFVYIFLLGAVFNICLIIASRTLTFEMQGFWLVMLGGVLFGFGLGLMLAHHGRQVVQYVRMLPSERSIIFQLLASIMVMFSILPVVLVLLVG